MNDSAAAGGSGFLTTSDLAGRADFSLGAAKVSPSRRIVSGPGGSSEIEPRVMQVLLVLADSIGSVVTRQTLFERCWGVSDVGDDSLNRAVARVRRIGAEIGAGTFAVETIPRTGYRLAVDQPQEQADAAARLGAAGHSNMSRRTAVGVTAGAVLAAAAGAVLWSNRQQDRRVQELIDRGVESLEYGDGSLDPARFLARVVEIDPRNPTAWGLLAFTLAANSDRLGDSNSQAIVTDAERAARTSLAIDPKDVNARLAMVLLRRASLDLATTEDQLRALLAAAPTNIFVLRQLWNLLQSAGRSRDALKMVDRAIAVRPLAAANNFPLGQLLWIVGRPVEADRVLERAIGYWPDHRFVRFARFMLLAYTGRAQAALAMIENKATAPQAFSPEAIALLRMSLAAFIDPAPATRALAREANVDAVRKDPTLARYAVLPLAALGEVDAAFDIANQLLVFDLPRQAGVSRSPSSSVAWRFTPWLFTPPVASMRADPRFGRLCESAGLTAYWRKRGIEPDYLAFPA